MGLRHINYNVKKVARSTPSYVFYYATYLYYVMCTYISVQRVTSSGMQLVYYAYLWWFFVVILVVINYIGKGTLGIKRIPGFNKRTLLILIRYVDTQWLQPCAGKYIITYTHSNAGYINRKRRTQSITDCVHVG